MKNLKSKTILPGFIDDDSHFWNAGFRALSANLLPAPDGKSNAVDTIISLLNNATTNGQKNSLPMSSYVQYRIAII